MLSLSSTQIILIRKQFGQKMRLNGKTVIVTGASRGIGAATAEEFASKGATVVLVAQDEKKLFQLAKKIGSKARVHVVNIAEFKQMEKKVLPLLGRR